MGTGKKTAGRGKGPLSGVACRWAEEKAVCPERRRMEGGEPGGRQTSNRAGFLNHCKDLVFC